MGSLVSEEVLVGLADLGLLVLEQMWMVWVVVLEECQMVLTFSSRDDVQCMRLKDYTED